MAVVWIDPYIDSPNGGIHGTIDGTTQDGSYSYPFPLSTNSSTGSATKTGLGLSTGDEVRIKGLPVDTFWGASVPFASVEINSGNPAYIQQYNVNAAHSDKFCRVKTVQSARLLYLNAYSNRYPTSYYSGAWVTQVPYLDQTFGSQLFDLNYALGNSTNRYLCYSGFSVGDNITLTAGWTSETVQGGETILTGTNRTLYAYIGQAAFTTDDLGHPLTINAPELSILGGSYGILYGNDITVRSLSGFEPAGYPPQVNATGNVTIQQYTCSWSTPYLTLYNYQSGGPAQSVLDVDFISPQYFGNIVSFATDKDTSVSRWKFKIKEFHSGAGLIDLSNGVPAGHTLDFEVKADYLLATKSSQIGFSDITELGTYTITGSGLTNEMAWNPTTYVGERIFAGKSAVAAANRSVITPYTGSNPEVGTSPFIQTSFDGSRAVFLAQLLNGTTSIETIDSSIGNITVSRAYGSPAKATILADEQGDKPCQLMFSSNSTTNAYPVIVFRSASFANKVTWHFTSYTDAGIYADTFAIDLPDFASSDLTFTAAFTTSSTPGVTIKAQLYTVNASGVISAYGLQTASVVGTAATISQVVTSATLTANAAKSAYVIVEMTKTSTAVANISINTIGLA